MHSLPHKTPFTPTDQVGPDGSQELPTQCLWLPGYKEVRLVLLVCSAASLIKLP